MYKACYAHQMRAADAAATELGGMPSILLMENAALACVNELKEKFDLTQTSVAVFCGKGNNGGDGLAIARHLFNMGVNVKVYLTNSSDFKGDAEINYDILCNIEVPAENIDDTIGLDLIIKSYDVVVDAILGTGIKGNVRGTAYEVIKLINENAKYVLSVDVPSGINSDTGDVCGVAVKADKTVTFAAYKIGMFMYPAADYTGEIIVDKISMPECALESQHLNINVTDEEFVRNIVGKRKNNSQKGDYGKLLIIAGSKGMSGAAYMASQAALKSGVGLVTLACPESINSILEEKTTEIMTLPLADTNGHFASSAIYDLKNMIEKVSAILIGPGIGRSPEAEQVVRSVMMQSKVPVIVDADAINAVAKDMTLLEECACDLIFTPHAMEMSRLTGLDISYIENNRMRLSADFAEANGLILLLKGHHTVVTDSGRMQYINITGNPGMASGGSGDVLSGICAALVARGVSCAKAAAAAAYIHGLAGDMAAENSGQESMSANNILECLPKAFCRILQLDKSNIK